MSANSMTPKQAAVALVAAMPIGVSVQQLEEYGIEATTEQAQAITQEVLSLNLFWIFAAIEAHIPQKYQSALSELILDAMEAGWGTTVPVGSAAWIAYLNEWQERRRRYTRLVEEGVSPLAVSRCNCVSWVSHGPNATCCPGGDSHLAAPIRTTETASSPALPGTNRSARTARPSCRLHSDSRQTRSSMRCASTSSSGSPPVGQCW